jgi:hypothetical protein
VYEVEIVASSRSTHALALGPGRLLVFRKGAALALIVSSGVGEMERSTAVWRGVNSPRDGAEVAVIMPD